MHKMALKSLNVVVRNEKKNNFIAFEDIIKHATNRGNYTCYIRIV